MLASFMTTARVTPRFATPRLVRVHAKQGDDKKGDNFEANVESAKSSPNVVESVKKAVIGGQNQEAKQGLTDSSSFNTDARASLEPRVQELRENTLTKGTTNREEIFKFSGPLPELLNGRLAMLGFFAAMSAELVSHKSLFEQIQTAPYAIAATFFTIYLASLIPIVRGNKDLPTDLEEGFGKSGFTLTNELILSRSAMLGFAILAGFEVLLQRPLFG